VWPSKARRTGNTSGTATQVPCIEQG
jgi:hypothetical protein